MTKVTLAKLSRMHITIPSGKKVPQRDYESEKQRDEKLLAESGETATAPLPAGEPIYKIVDEMITIRRETPAPATPRERVTFDWYGVKLTVLASPGQHINKAKEYKREMKRRRLAQMGKNK